MTNCQRCKKRSCSWTSDQVKLIGGVTAHLCVVCITEWHGIVTSSDDFKEQLRLDGVEAHYQDLAFAGKPVPKEDRTALVEQRNEILQKVRKAALEFVKPVPAPSQVG